MEDLVVLRDALMRQDIYGDLTKREVEYIPKENKVVFLPEETGYYKKQKAKTEELCYYPFLLGKTQKVCLAAITQKFRLTLKGEKLYRNGAELLARYAHMYDNEVYNAKGHELEDLEFYNLPEKIRLSDRKFWVMSYSCQRGFPYADNGQIFIHGAFSSGGYGNIYSHSICVIVHLPDRIVANVSEEKIQLIWHRFMERE